MCYLPWSSWHDMGQRGQVCISDMSSASKRLCLCRVKEVKIAELASELLSFWQQWWWRGKWWLLSYTDIWSFAKHFAQYTSYLITYNNCVKQVLCSEFYKGENWDSERSNNLFFNWQVVREESRFESFSESNNRALLHSACWSFLWWWIEPIH